MSTPSMARNALVLGLLSAVGPFAIDMYLPGMPQITEALNTSVQSTQATMSVYFASFGLSQLVYGPWADQSGRKLPIIVGLTLFFVGCLAAALAPTIGWLIAARFVQGAGAAAIMVIPRAIIRDMYTGQDGAKLMALVMLVISVSPMLAPLTGSGLMLLAGWRILFVALAVLALVCLAVTIFLQPETLARENRVPVRIGSMIAGAKTLVKDPVFMGLTFVGGFGMASFFVFIASASYVYTGEYGMTPTQFSLAFAVNAIGFFVASQLAAPLMGRKGALWVIRVGTTGFFGIAAALFALNMLGATPLPVIIIGLVTANAFLGLVIPTTMVVALDEHGDIAGMASSLGGTIQILCGGVMIAISGVFFDGSARPMLGGIAFCALLCIGIARLSLSRTAARVAA